MAGMEPPTMLKLSSRMHHMSASTVLLVRSGLFSKTERLCRRMMLTTQTLEGKLLAIVMADRKHSSNLQSTKCQHNCDTNLATGPQLQTMQQRHRYNNSRNVGEDAQSCLSKVECWSVHANSGRHFRKDPTSRDWSATEDVREDASERVADDEGEQRPYGDDDVSSWEDS